MIEIGDLVLATRWPDGETMDPFIWGKIVDINDKYIAFEGGQTTGPWRRVEKISISEFKFLTETVSQFNNTPGVYVWEILRTLRLINGNQKGETMGCRTVTVWTCDRCKEESTEEELSEKIVDNYINLDWKESERVFEKDPESREITVTNHLPKASGKAYLCSDCTSSFNRWLKERDPVVEAPRKKPTMKL